MPYYSSISPQIFHWKDVIVAHCSNA